MQRALLDDEDRIQDVYESLKSLKMIALQQQIRQKQKELDEVPYAETFVAFCCEWMNGR